MNAVGTLLGETVTKRYPRRGSVQLMRLRAAVSFTCSQCRQVKKSRLVAVSGANLLCNGCYGRGEAEATEQGQTPSSETAMSLRTSEPSSPPLGVEPSARGTCDPARIVVSQSDSGLPYSVMDADMTVTWKVHVRARDLLDGTCPVPAQMADKAPHTPLNAAFVRGRGRKARNIFDYQPGVRLRLDGGRTLLVGVSWHPHVLPGTRVSVRWDQRTRTRLHFSYTRLSKPVVFGGTVVRYAYDPKVMTRELAAFDVRLDRVEELVLIALRELGYLDERGRALLPQEALLRNTVERAQPERHSTKKIREATERLLSRGILTWGRGVSIEQASCTIPHGTGRRRFRCSVTPQRCGTRNVKTLGTAWAPHTARVPIAWRDTSCASAIWARKQAPRREPPTGRITGERAWRDLTSCPAASPTCGSMSEACRRACAGPRGGAGYGANSYLRCHSRGRWEGKVNPLRPGYAACYAGSCRRPAELTSARTRPFW